MTNIPLSTGISQEAVAVYHSKSCATFACKVTLAVPQSQPNKINIHYSESEQRIEDQEIKPQLRGKGDIPLLEIIECKYQNGFLINVRLAF